MTLMILMKKNIRKMINMSTKNAKTRAAKLTMKLKKNLNNDLIKALFIFMLCNFNKNKK